MILPRKFQIKMIPNEPNRQKTVRVMLALGNFKSEIELLKLRLANNEKNTKSIPEIMHRQINTHTNGFSLENTINFRKEACEIEESIAEGKLVSSNCRNSL